MISFSLQNSKVKCSWGPNNHLSILVTKYRHLITSTVLFLRSKCWENIIQRFAKVSVKRELNIEFEKMQKISQYSHHCQLWDNVSNYNVQHSATVVMALHFGAKIILRFFLYELLRGLCIFIEHDHAVIDVWDIEFRDESWQTP